MNVWAVLPGQAEVVMKPAEGAKLRHARAGWPPERNNIVDVGQPSVSFRLVAGQPEAATAPGISPSRAGNARLACAHGCVTELAGRLPLRATNSHHR